MFEVSDFVEEGVPIQINKETNFANEADMLPLGSLNCPTEITVSTPPSIDLKSNKEDVNFESSPFSYYPLSYHQTKKKQSSTKEHFEFNSNVLEESCTHLLLADPQ